MTEVPRLAQAIDPAAAEGKCAKLLLQCVIELARARRSDFIFQN